MPTVTRLFTFDYAHRVLGHEGHCRHLHGHRGIAEVTIKAEELDVIGRVLDFSVLKDLVGRWIDSNWDHNILLHRDDPLLELCVIAKHKYDPEIFPELHRFTGLCKKILSDKKPFVMPNGNPTVENMAETLFKQTRMLLPENIKVMKVRVWETQNCFADYEEAILK